MAAAARLLYEFTIPLFTRPTTKPPPAFTKLHVSSKSKPIAAAKKKKNEESIFFDGVAHYGDLVANLLFGFTLLWLPLTLATVFRSFNLRYRFTDLRVTVISGSTDQDRSDFSYKRSKMSRLFPDSSDEWGDVIITLKYGTKVDFRSVPKFREIAKYCLAMADQSGCSENICQNRCCKLFNVNYVKDSTEWKIYCSANN